MQVVMRTPIPSMKEIDRTFILLPAYLEGPSIYDVLIDLQKHHYYNIIVVDDGSTDETYTQTLKCPGIYVAKHLINRGKGAGIRTGIEIAKQLGAEALVTFDADGQHDASDISALLSVLRDGYDVALGVRKFDPQFMPASKIFANRIANFVTRVFIGFKTADSQSGLRAFNRKALDLIETKTDRYSYELEVLKEIKRHHLTSAEVPIKTIYTNHSTTKRERVTYLRGLQTLIKLITSI